MAFRGWAPTAFLTAGLLSVGPKWTLAQTSSVVCLSSFNWMFNSLQQSPCTVAAYLQSACDGGQFTYNPLPTGYEYVGPNADESNDCQCSTVTYNVVSACGLCQNRTIISWDTWSYNCTTVYPGILPSGVPGTTAVPQWAFQNVTAQGSDSFNVTLAQAVGDSPESTLIHAQSTGSASSTASVTLLPTSTSTSSSTSSGSTTNTGAIAGGVVGGVVGVALIAGAVIFFLRKKRPSQLRPSSAQYTIAASTMSPSSAGYTDTIPFNSQMSQPRFYNPDDPSTFPPTGQYTGAPQI